MAYISQHPSGWRVQIQKHGHRVSKVFPTKREAQAWALHKESELDALASGAGRTFGDLAHEYLKRVTPKKKAASEETRAVARLLKQIKPHTRLAEIDSTVIAAWRDKRAETVSGSTIQREANLLRNMFNVAKDEWRWLNHEPFRGVKLPKSNPPRTQIWTWQLIKRVLRAPRTGKTAQVQRAFHIALHTSLRLQEVLRHTYDPSRRVIVLADSKTGAAVVPVTRRAAKLLPAAPFTVGPDEASTLFRKLYHELLIDGLTFHDARASALTWLSRRMDVMTLARISRHKDISLLANTYYRETAEQISARL